jgi:hypothetical protein
LATTNGTFVKYYFNLLKKKFAAQSFSFLIQKLPKDQLKQYVDQSIDIISKTPNPNMYDGTSLLFFETMKGVYGNFHSMMPKMLPLLFRKLDVEDIAKGKNVEKEIPRRFLLLQKCFVLLSKHMLNRNVSPVLWKCVEDELNIVIQKWKANPNSNNGEQLAHIIMLMKCLIEKKENINGKNISFHLPLDKNIVDNLKIFISNELLLSKKFPVLAMKAIIDFIVQVLIVYRGENLKFFLNKNENDECYFDMIFKLKNYHMMSYFLHEINKSIYHINKSSIQDERNELTLKILQ